MAKESPHQIYDKTGKVIRRSKNLQGIRRYATEEIARAVAIRSIEEIDIPEESHCAEMSVTFRNGAYYDTKFGSFKVLKQWVRNWRAVYGAVLIVNGVEQGTVDSRNPALAPADVDF